MNFLGIDIGGTKCAVVLGNPEKEYLIVDKLTFPTCVEQGYQKVIAQLIQTADEILRRNHVLDIKGIGISCGGPLDSCRGIICCPPNLPDWDNVPIVSIFEEHFRTKVILQNDANACAVAEWKFGAGKGFENLVFLTFGTGMGAGLILNGKLYSGSCDMAGEVGHIRLSEKGPTGYGKQGSFEGFCSGAGIVKLAYYLSKQKKYDSPLADPEAQLSAKLLAQQALCGDPFAKEVYEECAKRLGQGLSLLIDILNPQAIIIGSIYQRSQVLFENIVMKTIQQEVLPQNAACCRILPAKLGDAIGDYAALSLAMEEEK